MSDEGPRPEPELGERQAAFVDAITTRLWSGLPMNEHDHAMAGWLARLLNLEPADLGERQARLIDTATGRLAALPPGEEPR